MNIASPLLWPAHLSSALSHSLSIWETTWPASFVAANIQLSFITTAGRVRGILHSKIMSGCKYKTITPRQQRWNLFKNNVTSHPSDTHCGWILCQPAGVQRLEKVFVCGCMYVRFWSEYIITLNRLLPVKAVGSVPPRFEEHVWACTFYISLWHPDSIAVLAWYISLCCQR